MIAQVSQGACLNCKGMGTIRTKYCFVYCGPDRCNCIQACPNPKCTAASGTERDRPIADHDGVVSEV